MSQNEDPVLTVARLLRTYLRVVKNDGSLADVQVSEEWCNRELMKNCDGQVTVGAERNEERRLSFDGNLRCRLSFVNVNVWCVDKPELGVVGRSMCGKICTDVCRVIREKRNKPNTVEIDYSGVGGNSETHRAHHMAAISDPTPTDSGWTELTSSEYEKIWYSDDDLFSRSVLENEKHAYMLFCFKIDADEDVLKQMVLKFEGYGLAPAGNGVTVMVWHFESSTWQNAAYGTDESDEVVMVILTSNLPNYVNDDGFVYLLVKTTNPSDGATPAVLYCDYVEVVFTVNGITHADVASFRDATEVRVKPFIWRTEFTIKTWLFENVPTI